MGTLNTHPPRERSFLHCNEDPSSTTLQVADATLLVICADSRDLRELAPQLLEQNLRILVATSIDEGRQLAPGTPHLFVELALPGARDFLREWTQEQPPSGAVALVEPGQSISEGLSLGATAVLTFPLKAADLLRCVARNRTRHTQFLVWQKKHQRSQQDSVRGSIEGLVSALDRELRGPLATALANVEYLRELLPTEVSDPNREDLSAVVMDTLTSLRRLQGTVEWLTLLGREANHQAQRISLWEAAQRGLDRLPRNRYRTNLFGDSAVRAWSDEATLGQVLSILLHRAAAALASSPDPELSVRIYERLDQACLTLRDNGHPMPQGERPGLLDPGTEPRDAATSALAFAMAQHAVLRMGGHLISSHAQAGNVVRLRLPLVTPSERR